LPPTLRLEGSNLSEILRYASLTLPAVVPGILGIEQAASLRIADLELRKRRSRFSSRRDLGNAITVDVVRRRVDRRVDPGEDDVSLPSRVLIPA
jgi:hypothetical protein